MKNLLASTATGCGLIVSSWKISFVAATATAPDTPSSDAASAAEDASSPTGDADVDAGAEASAPPRPREIVSTSGDPKVGASCDSVCKARGGTFAFTCAACQPGATAVGKSSNLSFATNPAAKKDAVIDACSAPLSATLTDGAKTYELSWYSCCCEAPKLEELAGANVASPTSCGDVCRGKGLSCDSENVCGAIGDGPFELTYLCGAGYEFITNTSGNDYVTTEYDCDSVPTAIFTRTRGQGGVCKLASYACACR